MTRAATPFFGQMTRGDSKERRTRVGDEGPLGGRMGR